MKIAIYSGEIPGTVFIERLIFGLAGKSHQIFLFGTIKKKVKYPSNVKVVGYTNRWQKLTLLLYYTILLNIFKRSKKNTLNSIISRRINSKKGKLKARLKYYPILWHAPDIFHLQWAKSVNDWQWVQLFDIKLVLSLRGAHINYSPVADADLAQTYKKCFPRVDRFHGVSKAICIEAEKYGAPGEKMDVIYSGLDLEKIKFKKKQFLFSNKSISILSIGRSHWAKGYNYALSAFKILKSRNVDFNYKIIGAAGNEELLYLQKSLGLDSGEVELLERVSFEEVMKFLEISDLLLLPSVEEGIANVVLEAMALGTPVLTTSCGGMGELVEDGVNGWVVPVRNPKAVADKLIEIQELLSNTIYQITEKAREKVVEQHDLNVMVAKMEQLYDKTKK